ncbi:MAG: hypothetical protein A2X64_10985 [Ignavibacteria bacterium GWF2_33_9]|nr:MAG: hypothetical protein A2X64_10985 [Ignavibacteria bacterium GWF2_33_9]
MITKKIINYSLILLLTHFSVLFADINVSEVENYLEQEIYLRLTNGDNFTCVLKEAQMENDSLFYITIQTKIGKTKVYSNEIAELIPQQSLNRQSNRIYLLPTAEPISNNHFISNYEVLFFYGGIGITDYVSITAGRSLIPNTPGEYQISELNAKATVYRQYWESMVGDMSIAVGANQIWLNSYNQLTHLYSALTFRTAKSVFTGAVFTKLGAKDVYDFKMSNGFDIASYPFVYENGDFGLALGLDTRLSQWKDIRIIGELWNSSIAQPSNTGVLLGVRLANTKFSADFGLAFFTSPILLPFTSFAWTPF